VLLADSVAGLAYPVDFAAAAVGASPPVVAVDSSRVAGPVETGASPFAFGSFDAGSFDDDHAASFAGDVGVAAVAAAAAVATPFDASFVDDATPTDRRIHSDGPLAVVGGDAAAFVDAAAAEAAAAGDNSHMAVHFDCTFFVSLFDFRLFIFL